MPGVTPAIVALITSAGAAWLLYFYLKDRLQPEPVKLLLLAVAMGIGSALLALTIFRTAEALGLPTLPMGSPGKILLYCMLLIGPVEEGCKFLAARVSVFRHRAFDETIDGMVYATAVAIGFASFENLLYLPHLTTWQGIARAAASPLTHSMFAAVWGYGAARALIGNRSPLKRFFWQASLLALSMLLHGTYDALLLAWGATLPASGLVLLLWAVLIWAAARRPRKKTGAAEPTN